MKGYEAAARARRAAPRPQHAVRDQVELRACDLEYLLAPEDRARAVWQFLQSLLPVAARDLRERGRSRLRG